MRPELRQEMVGLGMARVVIRRSFIGFMGIFTEAVAEAEAEEVDVFGESGGAL